MVGTYNPLLVLLSILVAIFVSYTALSLSARVARAKSAADNMGLWVAGGARRHGLRHLVHALHRHAGFFPADSVELRRRAHGGFPDHCHRDFRASPCRSRAARKSTWCN
jgi:hypothetical protein